MPSPTTGPESCLWVGVHLAGHGSTGDRGSENRREALSLSRLQMDREVGGREEPWRRAQLWPRPRAEQGRHGEGGPFPGLLALAAWVQTLLPV